MEIYKDIFYARFFLHPCHKKKLETHRRERGREAGCAGLPYPHTLSVSLGDVAVGPVPKPKELLSVPVSTRSVKCCCCSSAPQSHPCSPSVGAGAAPAAVPCWHLDIWTSEISGHLSKWGLQLQCVKARGVWICVAHKLEQHSFSCCLERSPQKRMENGFFLKCHHQNLFFLVPLTLPYSFCLCSSPLS